MPLSPLGERVSRDGAFISRRGTGEGVRFGLAPSPPGGHKGRPYIIASLLPTPLTIHPTVNVTTVPTATYHVQARGE